MLFFEKQKSVKKLYIEDTFGSFSCVVRRISSLTQDVDFCMLFSSNKEIDKLRIVSCMDRWFVEIDNNLYFVNLQTGKLVAIAEIYTPLMGLYVRNHKILVLEETVVRVFDFNGNVLQSHNVDLISFFKLEDSVLYIETIEGKQERIDLIF